MGNLKKKLEHIYKVRALVMQMEVGEEISFKKSEINAYTAASVYACQKSTQRYEIRSGIPWKSTMIKRIDNEKLKPSQMWQTWFYH